MNKTFDIKRLGMIMRWELLTRWKYYVGATIGCIVGYSLFSLVMLNDSCGYDSIELAKVSYLTREAAFSIPMVFCAFYVMASCIFDIMKTKNGRESFLMLPANKIEKYMSCFLMKFIGSLILLVFTLIGTDVIQLAFSFILDPGFHVSITLPVIKEWLDLPMFTHMREGDFIFLSFLVFAHSFCTLGGTLYRKRAPLLTFATGIFLFMVFGYIIAKLAGYGLLNFHISLYECNSYVAAAITCIFFLVLSAFNYWASYKIFTRMQVICNKWINI